MTNSILLAFITQDISIGRAVKRLSQVPANLPTYNSMIWGIGWLQGSNRCFYPLKKSSLSLDGHQDN